MSANRNDSHPGFLLGRQTAWERGTLLDHSRGLRRRDHSLQRVLRPKEKALERQTVRIRIHGAPLRPSAPDLLHKGDIRQMAQLRVPTAHFLQEPHSARKVLSPDRAAGPSVIANQGAEVGTSRTLVPKSGDIYFQLDTDADSISLLHDGRQRISGIRLGKWEAGLRPLSHSADNKGTPL